MKNDVYRGEEGEQKAMSYTTACTGPSYFRETGGFGEVIVWLRSHAPLTSQLEIAQLARLHTIGCQLIFWSSDIKLELMRRCYSKAVLSSNAESA
jgi:hypothetical protein